MKTRNKRLEQEKPKGDSPVKAWKRKAGEEGQRPGKFKLPKGKIAQHRAKPGMTSPQ